jgi:hypothetical protein
MKIRKILPLLTLAVVALFALSSCDQILESMFPADTNQLAGSNTLTVNVDTAFWSVGNDIYYGPLTVALVKNGTTLVEKRTYWLDFVGADPIQASWTFNGLETATYAAYVWIDYDNDGTWKGDFDYDAGWYGGNSYTFSGTKESWTLQQYVYNYSLEAGTSTVF